MKQDIAEMQLQTIDLCLSEMDMYTMDEDSMLRKKCYSSLKESPMKLVVYVDSSACTSCTLKNMYHWYDVIDETSKRYGDKFKIVFIFSPSEKQGKFLKAVYLKSMFDYPIFIDIDNKFMKQNGHIPNNSKFYTFLLDVENRIQLVGCPLGNEKIMELMIKVADKFLLE